MVWTATPSLRARVFQQSLAYDNRQERHPLPALKAERQGRSPRGRLPGAPSPANGVPLRRLNLSRRQNAGRMGKLLREIRKRQPAWILAVAGRKWPGSACAGDLDGAGKDLREGLKRLPGTTSSSFSSPGCANLRRTRGAPGERFRPWQAPGVAGGQTTLQPIP